MIEPRIRRVRPGRRAMALFASVALVGGLAGGVAGHMGTAHAQGTPTPAAGSPPPPPAPPAPPAPPSAPRPATTTAPAPPAPPAPPRASATPAARPAATSKAQAPAAAPAAQKPVVAAPAAQKPVVVAAPALPNTGTGNSSQSSSPLAALAAVFGGLTLLGSSLALRFRSRKG